MLALHIIPFEKFRRNTKQQRRIAMINQDSLKSLLDDMSKRKIRDKEWEISRSSLARVRKNPTYNECREYACKDICSNTLIKEQGYISELPRGSKFNFIVRVGTDFSNPNEPSKYYGQFERRNFISFSTINNKNVSHYGLGGGILFAYNITPDLIAHIFPMDCDSNPYAVNEEDITEYPSIWLTLSELNAATIKLKTYNQVTCRTKSKADGRIIMPSRVIAIDSINSRIESVAKAFGIGCTIVHPNKNAISEQYDPFLPIGSTDVQSKRKVLFKELKKMYSLE